MQLLHVLFVLFKTNFSNGIAAFAAKVRPLKTVYMDTVIARMKQRGIAPSAEQLSAWIEDYYATVETLVQEGYRVVTPLVVFGLRIKGPFSSRHSPFDPNLHEVLGYVKPTSRYQRLFKQPLTAERLTVSKINPELFELIDKASGEVDGLITPGETAYLHGENLKFDPADETQGIFLVGADGTETRVTEIIRNVPAELIFDIPEGLAAGEYRLIVRAKIRGGRELRQGELEATLSVS